MALASSRLSAVSVADAARAAREKRRAQAAAVPAGRRAGAASARGHGWACGERALRSGMPAGRGEGKAKGLWERVKM